MRGVCYQTRCTSAYKQALDTVARNLEDITHNKLVVNYVDVEVISPVAKAVEYKNADV